MAENDDSIIVKAGAKTYFFDLKQTRDTTPYLLLGHKANGPTYHKVDPLYTYGSDGNGALTCIPMVVMFLPGYWLRMNLAARASYESIIS